jgi:hypothetical protein
MSAVGNPGRDENDVPGATCRSAAEPVPPPGLAVITDRFPRNAGPLGAELLGRLCAADASGAAGLAGPPEARTGVERRSAANATAVTMRDVASIMSAKRRGGSGVPS